MSVEPAPERVLVFDDRDRFTKLTNALLDLVMPVVSPTAWKVLCFILRNTRGWGKDAEELSLAEIQKGTGIKSHNTVKDAIEELAEGGYVFVTPASGRKAARFRLNTDLAIASSKVSKNDSHSMSKNDSLQDVNPSKNDSLQGDVKESNGLKKKTKKNGVGADAPPQLPLFGAKPEPKGKRPRKPPKEPNPHSKHPAVVLFKDKRKRSPNEDQMAAIVTAVGDAPESLQRWGDVLAAWTLAGNKPTNVTGQLDWHRKGIPKAAQKQDGRGGARRTAAQGQSQGKPTEEQLETLRERNERRQRESALLRAG